MLRSLRSLLALTIALGAGATIFYAQRGVLENKKRSQVALDDLLDIVVATMIWEGVHGKPVAQCVMVGGKTVPFTLDENSPLKAGMIMPSLPYDPWGSPYQLDVHRGIVYSMGEDRVPNTADDIFVSFVSYR